jgi:integrase
MTIATARTEPLTADTSVEAVESTHISGSADGWVRPTAPQRHQHEATPEIVELVGALNGTAGEGVNAERGRRHGAGLLLDHLCRCLGGGWQERWAASGLDQVGPDGFRQAVCAAAGLSASAARLWQLSSGLGALMAVDVIRPSFDFLLGARLNHTWTRLLAWRQDPHADILDRVGCTAQTRSRATALLARLVVVTGRPVSELTVEDLLACRAAVLARSNQTVGLGHLWLCLADAGIVEGTLAEALRPGRKSVTELVDRYDLASRPARNLLIAYLTERSVNVDYSTLRGLVTHLCLRFWKQVEQLAPGIDTIDLPDDVAAAWKEAVRWRTDHNGTRVRTRGVMDTLMTVRGFYADLIQLAHEDPGRWAQWACRPPVSEAEVKAYRKWRLSLRSEMHQRTRARAVHVGQLADVAERTYQRMRVLLDAARAAGSGEQFTVESTTWRRVDGASHPQAHPRVVPVDAIGEPVGERLDMVIEEEDAFWGFAVVEVLRHTGIRIEELLELSQLDLHIYQHPDPAVGTVLLLHVNPSKQDRERMVVVPPELAAVFAAMSRRIRSAVDSRETALPALVACDYGECVNSEPLPFLFQRTAGRGFKGTTRPMHKTYVARVLNKVVAAADLRGLDGTLLDFTPHDFRRIFATDAVAAGLPPHLIQKLMGHATLATTQAYAAVFPDDVIRGHRAFIHNRRSLRPADEYRDVTAEEWDEFEQHFPKRKIAIGDCMRAYGTNCVHEYACEQCKLARPDPDAEPRLQRTRDGLVDQLDEARQRGWLGEIERLTHILAAVGDKLGEIERATRRVATVELMAPPRRRTKPST